MKIFQVLNLNKLFMSEAEVMHLLQTPKQEKFWPSFSPQFLIPVWLKTYFQSNSYFYLLVTFSGLLMHSHEPTYWAHHIDDFLYASLNATVFGNLERKPARYQI